MGFGFGKGLTALSDKPVTVAKLFIQIVWFMLNTCLPFGSLEMACVVDKPLGKTPWHGVSSELPWLVTLHTCCENSLLRSIFSAAPLEGDTCTSVPDFSATSLLVPFPFASTLGGLLL